MNTTKILLDETINEINKNFQVEKTIILASQKQFSVDKKFTVCTILDSELDKNEQATAIMKYGNNKYIVKLRSDLSEATTTIEIIKSQIDKSLSRKRKPKKPKKPKEARQEYRKFIIGREVVAQQTLHMADPTMTKTLLDIIINALQK